MKKIRNINGSGKCKLGGYADPVESGRGGSRQSPDSFSGAAHPSSPFKGLSFIKKQLIAAFFAVSLFIMAVPGALIMTGCDTNQPKETALPPANQAPTAKAGIDQYVTLASNLTVTLDGTASTDPDDGIASYAWTCTSYTANKGAIIGSFTKDDVSITNANKAAATVDLRKAGTYVFQLTVTDNSGATATDKVTVTVDPMSVPENVTVTFPTFATGATLNLTPNGIPTDSNVVYTVIDGLGGEWNSITGFEISVAPFSAPGTTFTQFIKDKSGNVLSSQEILAGIVNVPIKRFSSLSIDDAITMEFTVDKPVTEL